MEDPGQGSTPLSFKIIGHLSKILARNQGANKTETKELEKDLALLGQADADALVEAGTLELLLRYLAVEQHFDVIAKCLMALSAYDTARAGLYDMHQSGLAHLAKSMFNQSRGAKGEKQIDRATVLGKILVLYSIDAPESHLSWLTTLCDLLTESLDKATTKGGQQEAYVYLSVVLPSMWVSMGSTLAPIIAAHIIDAGGMPLLLRVAKEVQRNDIKGLPKIIAEKALNLLCACNAEQPELSLDHVDVGELANFCVETTTRSDWVQSQELSLVLLGRLVFLQHCLSEEYLETDPVVRMFQHALESKSPALRMTALCLTFICSEALFEHVCVEANKVIIELGQGSYQSVKRLSGAASGGITVLRWGQPINKFAQDLLKGSTLLARMAETVPAHLPSQLVELLSPDLKTYVTGIKAAHGVKESPAKTPAAQARRLATNQATNQDEGDEYYEEEPAHAEPPMQPVQAQPARKPLAAANAAVGNGAMPSRPMANGQPGGGVRVVSNVKQIIGAQPMAARAPASAPQGPVQANGLHLDMPDSAPGQTYSGPGAAQKRPRQSSQGASGPESEGDEGLDEPSKRSKVGGKANGTPMVHHHMASMMAAAQRPGGPAPPVPGPGQPSVRPPGAQLAPGANTQSQSAHVAMLAAQAAMVTAQATLAKVRQQQNGSEPPANQGSLPPSKPAGSAPSRAPVPKAPLAQPPVLTQQQALSQPGSQQAARGGSGGGATTSGNSAEGNRGFGTKDLSQLNQMLFELVMQGEQLNEKSRTVLSQLMLAMEKVGKLLPLKHRLPPDGVSECETMLRNWGSRVRQMGSSLTHAQGPALEMLVNFSNMMVEEVTAYLDDAERQAQAA